MTTNVIAKKYTGENHQEDTDPDPKVFVLHQKYILTKPGVKYIVYNLNGNFR
jgi:hypothetical protein